MIGKAMIVGTTFAAGWVLGVKSAVVGWGPAPAVGEFFGASRPVGINTAAVTVPPPPVGTPPAAGDTMPKPVPAEAADLP
jgi:hypothetical protein